MHSSSKSWLVVAVATFFVGACGQSHKASSSQIAGQAAEDEVTVDLANQFKAAEKVKPGPGFENIKLNREYTCLLRSAYDDSDYFVTNTTKFVEFNGLLMVNILWKDYPEEYQQLGTVTADKGLVFKATIQPVHFNGDSIAVYTKVGPNGKLLQEWTMTTKDYEPGLFDKAISSPDRVTSFFATCK